jgi:hypothetical protein
MTNDRKLFNLLGISAAALIAVSAPAFADELNDSLSGMQVGDAPAGMTVDQSEPESMSVDQTEPPDATIDSQANSGNYGKDHDGGSDAPETNTKTNVITNFNNPG